MGRYFGWERHLRDKAKTRWHSESRDFTTYTYKCYDQTQTGTISARLKNGLSIEGVCRAPLVQDWKIHTMAQKVLHAVFDDPEGTLREAAAVLGLGAAGVEQAEVLRDKSIIEEKLKKEQGRYETLLDMRMNNEIPREVFGRKQQEVEKKIAELEQQMMQYGDVKPATEADVSGKLCMRTSINWYNAESFPIQSLLSVVSYLTSVLADYQVEK